ncbi:PREDICTED: uncharacterized protein LOC109240621 [Nicotiana attenuata]|uniref:uncharacterized protein LOC109240621 n=1 Tax=Nicotiana attenuata TaxID=49451 RepID=UPI000904BA3B|nr:PREDICTED: uncharacterized protein LOC109240621 [Nicotiana attenuata]
MVSSGTAELFFLKIKWANFSSEVLFVLIVGAEAYVTMRSQFPHPNKVMLVHAAVTLATSVGAMICLARDIHVNVRNKLPMQGRRERDFENCWYGYAKLCNYCRNIWVTAKLLSIVDNIRVVASILQVFLRFCELVARSTCAKYGCKGKVLEFNFSIIPLLLAFACFAKRTFS